MVCAFAGRPAPVRDTAHATDKTACQYLGAAAQAESPAQEESFAGAVTDTAIAATRDLCDGLEKVVGWQREREWKTIPDRHQASLDSFARPPAIDLRHCSLHVAPAFRPRRTEETDR